MMSIRSHESQTAAGIQVGVETDGEKFDLVSQPILESAARLGHQQPSRQLATPASA